MALMSAVLGQEFLQRNVSHQSSVHRVETKSTYLAAMNSVIIDRHDVTLKAIRPGT